MDEEASGKVRRDKQDFITVYDEEGEAVIFPEKLLLDEGESSNEATSGNHPQEEVPRDVKYSENITSIPLEDSSLGFDLRPRVREDNDDFVSFRFISGDSDCYTKSIAELYSYSEVSEFECNMRSFEELLVQWKVFQPWQLLDSIGKQSIILQLINQLDMVDIEYRRNAKNALLYIAQGCWKEVRCLKDQQEWALYNVSLLMQNGVFGTVIELLFTEVEKNSELAASGKIYVNKKDRSMLESVELRVSLNLLYTMVETVRCNESLHSFLPYIKSEISETTGTKKLLATLLFDMLADYAYTKENSHLPVKKIILLLWKVLLISLGGEKELRQLRKQRRESFGLPPEQEYLPVDDKECKPGCNCSNKESDGDWDTEAISNIDMDGDNRKRVFRELPNKAKSCVNKKLFPHKITRRELDQYVTTLREKFFGINYPGMPPPLEGNTNLQRLPPFLIDSLNVLQSNVHTSLADYQLNFEDKKLNWPHTFGYELESIQETETLYESLLPNLAAYTTSIVKVLTLVAPGSSTRNISEVVPCLPVRDLAERLVRNVDASRHKEIIFTALSAITLLLLKHTKVNHVLQFEHLSQQLVKSDTMMAFYAFFQEFAFTYARPNYEIGRYNFPICVFGNLPEVTLDEIRKPIGSSGNQRCILGHINAARILNKLTKGKTHRVIYMAKTAYYRRFREALKVNEPTFHRYLVKLLKMQTKYIWRCKPNSLTGMKMLTAMYGKVRTNLTDEWVSYKDEDYPQTSRLACYFLEPTIQLLMRRYHWRKYCSSSNQNVVSGYASECSLPDSEETYLVIDNDEDEEELFKKNYELWLENDVFKNPVDWDAFLKEDIGNL